MRALRRFLRAADKGAAALELGLLAPMFILLMIGGVELGNLLLTRFSLDAAVDAGANFSLVNAAGVGTSTDTTLASNVATVVANSNATGWANAVVTVNNGAIETITAGTASASGAVSNACYCPTGSPGSWTWGSAVVCGNSCVGGGTAGKFVTISASRAYTPLFPLYNIITAGTLTAGALVQAQ